MRWLLLTFSVALAGYAGIANAQSLDVTFATTPTSGRYYPAHVVAVWVEAADGTFERTLHVWGGRRRSHLAEWNSVRSGAESLDGITSATLRVNSPEDVTWDLRDASGALVPDGDYVIHFEYADTNSISANYRGQFTFTKGTHQLVETMQETPFQPVAVDYTPGSAMYPPPDAGGADDAGVAVPRVIPIGRGYGSRGCSAAPLRSSGAALWIAAAFALVLVRRRR